MSTERLLAFEMRRGLWRIRSLILLAALLVVSVYALFVKTPLGLRPGLWGAFAGSSPELFTFMAPLVASLAAGDLLAWDLSTHYARLIFARGVTRRRYALVKAIAVMLSTGIVMGLSCSAFFLLAAIKLPWQRSLLSSTPLPEVHLYPGPVPALFLSNPALNDLLGVAMLIFGTAALSTTSMAAATLVRNRYFAFLSPFIVSILTLYLLKDSTLASAFSQFSMLYPWGPLYKELPNAIIPFAGFLYWTAYAILMVSLTLYRIQNAELD